MPDMRRSGEAALPTARLPRLCNATGNGGRSRRCGKNGGGRAQPRPDLSPGNHKTGRNDDGVSVRVSSQVWKRSAQKGSALLLLLAIADHAHEDGGGSFASQLTLAGETRLSERQVRRLLKQLTASGELAVAKRPGTTDMFTVLPGGDKMSDLAPKDTVADVRATPDAVTSGTPDISASTPDMTVSDEPSIQPSSSRHRTASPKGAAQAPPSARNYKDDPEAKGVRNTAATASQLPPPWSAEEIRSISSRVAVDLWSGLHEARYGRRPSPDEVRAFHPYWEKAPAHVRLMVIERHRNAEARG